MRKLHGHKENTATIVLCDVTAYAVVCLPSRFLETCCITPLYYCFVCVLLRNSCYYASAVLVWGRYATILTICNIVSFWFSI
jgi:hypothetical protein